MGSGPARLSVPRAAPPSSSSFPIWWDDHLGPLRYHQGLLPTVRSDVSLRCNPAWALEQTLTQAQDLLSPSAHGRWCPSSPGAEPHVVGTTGAAGGGGRGAFRGMCSRGCVSGGVFQGDVLQGMCFEGITLTQMLEPEASLETRRSQLLFWAPSPAVSTCPQLANTSLRFHEHVLFPPNSI